MKTAFSLFITSRSMHLYLVYCQIHEQTMLYASQSHVPARVLSASILSTRALACESY